MKKLIPIIIILLIFISGCKKVPEHPQKIMTNDEVISETKRCESEGLKAKAISDAFSDNVYRIQCLPKD